VNTSFTLPDLLQSRRPPVEDDRSGATFRRHQIKTRPSGAFAVSDALALKRVYGIDLGTTYSAIAYVDEHGKPVVVPCVQYEQKEEID